MSDKSAGELVLHVDSSDMSKPEAERFMAVAAATDVASGKERRAILARHPGMAEKLGDVSRVVERSLVAAFTEGTTGAGDSLAEGMGYKCAALRRENGYDESSELERLLIDRLVACWLHVQHVERRRTTAWSGSSTFDKLSFYDQAASRANADFLRASVALARVRRLLRPSVAQINIAAAGGQQVNQVVGS